LNGRIVSYEGYYILFQLGSCEESDISARVLTRVLSHFPGERNQLIIDAGFTALSGQGFEQLGQSYAYIKVFKNC
jgi:D-serine deaminase-like pyridoxal phosphate-dependent protein